MSLTAGERAVWAAVFAREEADAEKTIVEMVEAACDAVITLRTGSQQLHQLGDDERAMLLDVLGKE
jgi:hypothetical protein